MAQGKDLAIKAYRYYIPSENIPFNPHKLDSKSIRYRRPTLEEWLRDWPRSINKKYRVDDSHGENA